MNMNVHKDWRFSPRSYGASPLWARLGIAEAENIMRRWVHVIHSNVLHLFIGFISVNDVVYGKQYGAYVVQPLWTNRHCSRKASIEASINPSGTIIRW